MAKYIWFPMVCCIAASNAEPALADRVDPSGIDVSIEQGITKFRKGDDYMKVGVRITSKLEFALDLVTFQCVAMDQDNAIGTADGMVTYVAPHGIVFETAIMETPEKKPDRVDCRITGATIP